MNYYGYWKDRISDPPDPYKLFYRVFGAVLVIGGIWWLSLYKQGILQAGKLAFMAAGFCWSKFLRPQPYGFGLFFTTIRIRRDPRYLAAAIILSLSACLSGWWAGLVSGQMIHWIAGGLVLIIGMNMMLLNIEKKKDEDEPDVAD